MNRTQAHWALLKVSSLVCAVLFVLICVSILDTRPHTGSSEMREIVGDVVRRVPAAIPNLLKEKPKPQAANNFQVWQPPCLDANTKMTGMKTDSAWVRVSTHNCDPTEEISESKLENKSNGYVATMFSQSRSKTTSDFIPLADGANQFNMEVKLRSGERFSYQWTIDKTAAAN